MRHMSEETTRPGRDGRRASPESAAALGALSLMLGLVLGSAQALAFDCTALTGAAIPKSAIALPTSGAVVASASLVSDPRNGTYCKLVGGIKPVDTAAPDIKFQVNLPEHWNGKALHIGGGGYNGALITAEAARFPDPAKPSPLRQGYASFGSDSGHQTKAGQDMAAFALNTEALANFAGDQLKKTHDAAMTLIAKAYGHAPRRVYFQGNSQGGHEGFIVAQRWPGDYDGIIAIHPVYDFVALQVDGVLLGQAIYNRPGAWLSPAQAALVSTRVLESCDGLDGLKDGLIGNVKACRSSFDVNRLACGEGRAGPDCLTPPQLESLRILSSPVDLRVTLAGGVDNFAPWPVLEGAAGDGRFSPFGLSSAKPKPPLRSDSFLLVMGDQLVRYMVLGDSTSDSLAFDPARHAAALQALSKQMDASDPDISAFRRRGGKLLIMHGTVDLAVTPYNSVAYYEKLKAKFGAGLPNFVRYYMAPGFGHGDGNFRVGWDSLGALDDWVTKDQPPGPQVISDTNAATLGRTRPLCEYPAFPKYNGSGDVNQAASFSCAAP